MDSIINYQYAYVEIHFHPWFILFKKEKNFHIKTKENMQQNTEFPRTCSPLQLVVCLLCAGCCFHLWFVK